MKKIRFALTVLLGLSLTAFAEEAKPQEHFVIDVGGGSTEIIAGMAGGSLEHAHSFQIGCRRVTERFFTQDPPGAELVGKAAERIADEMTDYLGMLIEGGYMAGRVIAVAGTATSIVSMREEMEVYDSTRVHGTVVTRADLDALIAKLQDMPLADRQKIVGLNPQRAPVILAGIVILQQIMEVTGIDEFTVSESDILQGVVLATASR
jgi:exopolyphosphatase/guanosine-5'-triphosphate,3'-diphosphate pyrophosphatase